MTFKTIRRIFSGQHVCDRVQRSREANIQATERLRAAVREAVLENEFAGAVMRVMVEEKSPARRAVLDALNDMMEATRK